MDKKVINALYEKLENCTLCPRFCKVNRKKDEKGICRAGLKIRISSVHPHFGEEPPLVGRFGSGTIFFSYCNLRCLFCQNYTISHLEEGYDIDPTKLATLMLYLQNYYKVHNINLVTPTHYVPQIVQAIYIARNSGLQLPIVYNCGGYENPEVIELLDGFIDIYMPDIKFFDYEASLKYLKAKDYPDYVRESVKIMHKQVGDLVIKNGVAVKGLLIRHLVMPGFTEDSKRILDFIANELSINSYVNIMDQYYPCYKAFDFPEISRRISYSEYLEVINYAKSIGLKRGF